MTDYTPEDLERLWTMVRTLNDAIDAADKDLDGLGLYTYAKSPHGFMLTYALEGMRRHRAELQAEIDAHEPNPYDNLQRGERI